MGAPGPACSAAAGAAASQRASHAESGADEPRRNATVAAESLDHGRLFRASRYGKGGGDDYLNAPLGEAEYDAFLAALTAADPYTPHHDFDRTPFFEGCLPVEEMARRGRDVLRFGPMKPVGLRDPRADRMPFSVVQLRQEDRAGQMWNLVGFQTRLKTGAQQRIFRTIPGLEQAEFLRYGSIHRNTYLNTPATLTQFLAPKSDPLLLFAGQLTGVEGYTESAATGMMAGINLARLLAGMPRPLRRRNGRSRAPLRRRPSGAPRSCRRRRACGHDRAAHGRRAPSHRPPPSRCVRYAA